MKAAWYEKQGSANEVLIVGEMDDPIAGDGEVRIRLAASGINPGDVKKRQNAFSYGMPFPRIIPHGDGAGVIDQVGKGVPEDRLGQRVWCHGAQTYRPFGTAAEYTVVPVWQAVPLPPKVSMELGACLGIPGVTAHRSVHIAGSVTDRTVLVQGGAGAVGVWAIQLARQAGAYVIATCRSGYDREIALKAGANHALLVNPSLNEQIQALVPNGIHHIVDVAFDENIQSNTDLIAQGGSIAAYATQAPRPEFPFWPLVFRNISIYFIGSDDVPSVAKIRASHDVNLALENGWPGPFIAKRLPLESIVLAHELVERSHQKGRVILTF